MLVRRHPSDRLKNNEFSALRRERQQKNSTFGRFSSLMRQSRTPDFNRNRRLAAVYLTLTPPCEFKEKMKIFRWKAAGSRSGWRLRTRTPPGWSIFIERNANLSGMIMPRPEFLNGFSNLIRPVNLSRRQKPTSNVSSLNSATTPRRWPVLFDPSRSVVYQSKWSCPSPRA